MERRRNTKLIFPKYITLDEKILKVWTLRMFFYVLPVVLKLSDLALTLHLLKFPWTYESNPLAFWIIKRGVAFSLIVFICLSLVAGATLYRLFKKILDPKVKKNIKILCGIALCFSYSIMVLPVINNLMVADQIDRWLSQNTLF